MSLRECPPDRRRIILPPRIGTFGQSGTLGNFIDRLSPALLSLVHGLKRGIPNFGLDVMLGHRELYGLTRTGQRFRCLEVGNRLSRTLTALAVFAFGGKIGVAQFTRLPCGSPTPSPEFGFSHTKLPSRSLCRVRKLCEIPPHAAALPSARASHCHHVASESRGATLVHAGALFGHNASILQRATPYSWHGGRHLTGGKFTETAAFRRGNYSSACLKMK